MNAITDPTPDIATLARQLDELRLCLVGCYVYMLLVREGQVTPEDERIFARTFAYGYAKYGKKFEVAYLCVADMVPD